MGVVTVLLRSTELVPASWRKAAPEVLRRTGRSAALAVGRATPAMRAAPDFVLVGAQRCGTTSLFRSLIGHPQVARPTVFKGVNYFDLNYFRGWSWYLAHFPVSRALAWKTRHEGPPSVFEASGYYLYHPFAMERMARDLPGAKIVVMLRDPVERAYSAYQHELARGFEWEDFLTALDLEEDRLIGEVERMRRDPTYESFSHRHHSYLHRGHYAEQLERVLRHYPRDQVHVVMSEDFFAQPGDELSSLCAFLGLQPSVDTRFDRYNAQPRSDMSSAARERLQHHYGPHDKELAGMLGKPLPWHHRDLT